MDKNTRTPEEDLPKEKKLQLYISKAILEYNQVFKKINVIKGYYHF